MTLRRLWLVLAILLLLAGLARFVQTAVLPAASTFNRTNHTMLSGDFGAAFPTAYFARLRPDFPTSNVWRGWSYGPMLHFITLPLFVAPAWWMVPGLWALVNLAALTISFALVCRLAGVSGRVSPTTIVALGGLWLWFKPLLACFASGNIELLEMTMVLGAVAGLPHTWGRRPGILLGMAAMIKFLPIGFLGWLMIHRQWRAVRAGLATMAVIAAVTTVTLGWRNSTAALPPDFRAAAATSFKFDGQEAANSLAMFWGGIAPQVGPDAQSLPSLFVHFSGLIDFDNRWPYLGQQWFPTSRLKTALTLGALASLWVAIGYGLLLWRQRHKRASAYEVSGLFIGMVLLLPYNHQYYYVFTLVPLSVLFLRGVADRQYGVVALTLVAYCLISPIFRYTWIDRTEWFAVPFFYIHAYWGLMVFGALLLWATATYQMLSAPDESVSVQGLPRK